MQAVNKQLGVDIAKEVKLIATDETGEGGKQVAGFITTQNGTIYSNEQNQNTAEDTMYTLGQELAGSYQKSQGIDITTNRDQHNAYQNMVAGDTIDDITFLSNNYNLNINLDTANNHNTNTNLQANNININTAEDTTIKGANLNAEDTLTLNTKNLEVASVQNTTKSKSHGEGFSAGFGASGLTSLGMNTSSGNSNSKDTLLTSLTGNSVDVTVEQDTKLRGATIAAVDNQGNDNSNLTLKTNTLTASSLNNTYSSKSTSVGINLSGATDKAQISNVGIDYSNDRTNSKTKTLATLGSGNIQISDTENSDTKMLNTDVANNEVDIYNISSHKGLKGELDTRLLTEDGRKQIAEDLERTKRLGESIADVATSDAYQLQDTFNHIDEVQKDLDIQKQFALQNGGQGIETLQGDKSTIAQKQEAIKQYAKIYADTYGISIEEANIIAVNKFVKGATNNQINNNDIFINDNAQNNALDYANIMGHEVTHARVNQGTTRDRGSETLNEEYAKSMGSYSADGMEFSANSYTNINLNLNLNTNNHVQTNYDNLLLKSNTNDFVDIVKKDGNKVDFDSYWTLGDINRMNTLDNPKSPIESKINALVATGLTPDEIKQSLGNNADFKTLIKNGDEKFNAVYAEQKVNVDKINKLTDNIVTALKASELALGGREVVKNIAEAITKKSLEFSVKNAVTSSGTDATIQVLTQLYNDENLRDELKTNPTETIKKIVNSINWVQTATAAGIGSSGTKTENIISRIGAKKTVQNQLDKTSSTSLQNKLTDRLEKINNQITNTAIIGTTPLVVKPILNNDVKEKVEEKINENLPKRL